jgi:hypothetical protein
MPHMHAPHLHMPHLHMPHFFGHHRSSRSSGGSEEGGPTSANPSMPQSQLQKIESRHTTCMAESSCAPSRFSPRSKPAVLSRVQTERHSMHGTDRGSLAKLADRSSLAKTRSVTAKDLRSGGAFGAQNVERGAAGAPASSRDGWGEELPMPAPSALPPPPCSSGGGEGGGGGGGSEDRKRVTIGERVTGVFSHMGHLASDFIHAAEDTLLHRQSRDTAGGSGTLSSNNSQQVVVKL